LANLLPLTRCGKVAGGKSLLAEQRTSLAPNSAHTSASVVLSTAGWAVGIELDFLGWVAECKVTFFPCGEVNVTVCVLKDISAW
jgi:hypothetical protein